MSKSPKTGWIIFGTLSALLMGAFAFLYLATGVRVEIKNLGPAAMRKVSVHVTGNSYSLGDIPAGASKTVRVNPQGESSVSIKQSNAKGQQGTLSVDCYFERGYSGKITIQVKNGKIQHVKNDIRLTRLLGGSPRGFAPAKQIAGDTEYGFLFTETTGITRYVMHQGKQVAIQLRADSDPQAVRSLQAVGADILYNQADGRQMVLIGKLHPKVLRTPDNPRMAQSQPYQEFSLRGWRLNN